MEITTQEIFAPDTIKKLNASEEFKGKLIEIRKGETLDPYTDYHIYQDDQKIYTTIYPVELLVKVAQLFPTFDVKLASNIIEVGDQFIRQETLRLQICSEITI